MAGPGGIIIWKTVQRAICWKGGSFRKLGAPTHRGTHEIRKLLWVATNVS